MNIEEQRGEVRKIAEEFASHILREDMKMSASLASKHFDKVANAAEQLAYAGYVAGHEEAMRKMVGLVTQGERT